MTHTPGTWAVSKVKARRVTSGGVVICNAVLRNSGSSNKGIRHGAKAEAEAEANAHLIAAAPDLLAACEAYAAAYDAGTGTVYINDQMRAAIAKARNTPALHVEVL